MILKYFKYFLLLYLSVTGVAHAACGYGSSSKTGYVSKTIPADNIIVQRDIPVGTVIKSYTIQQSYDPQFGCSTAWELFFNTGIFSTSSSISGVYKTNVDGIGIKITDSYFSGTVPFKTSVGANIFNAYDTYTISIIKTGPVTPGVLSSGVIMTAGISGYMNAWDISVPGGIKISTVACSVTTPNLIFPIGDVLTSSFGSSVGTIPSGAQNTQNLVLNCDAGTNINVMLQGVRNPDISNTSVLALTGQGNADVAKGVGVQLLYNGSPLVLNNTIWLKTSPGGQLSLPITARYYQTKSSVSTGKANAAATLDVTYQ